MKQGAADPAQRVNWQRKKTFDDDSADSTRTAKRRKGEEKATHGKRRKIAILNFSVVLSSGVPPANKCAESTGRRNDFCPCIAQFINTSCLCVLHCYGVMAAVPHANQELETASALLELVDFLEFEIRDLRT